MRFSWRTASIAPTFSPISPSISPPRQTHLPALDALRGIAILLVMVFHFSGGNDAAATGLDKVFSNATAIGRWGVDLFFVLSGFLITGILLDTKGSPTFLRDFYARRALRIFPLYYAALLGLFILLPLFASIPNLEQVSQHQAWLWTYTSNLGMFFRGEELFSSGPIRTGHFWSLAIEEQFYLLWPLAVLWLSPRALARTCFALIATGLAGRFALALIGNPSAYYLTPCRLDGLMIGALLALALRSGWTIATLSPLARRTAALTGLALLPIFALGMNPLHQPGWIERAVWVFAYTAVAAFSGAILILSLTARGHWSTALNNRPLRFFGKYSYGLYIWHYLLWSIFNQAFSVKLLNDHIFGHYWPSRLANLALCIAASTAAAWLSWHLFERHFLKLKKHFNYDTTHTPTKHTWLGSPHALTQPNVNPQ